MVTIITHKKVHLSVGFLRNATALALLGFALLLNDTVQAQTFEAEYQFGIDAETAAIASQEDRAQDLDNGGGSPAAEPPSTEERSRGVLCGLFARCSFLNLSHTFDTGERTYYRGPILIYPNIEGIGQNVPICRGGRSQPVMLGEVAQQMAIDFCQEHGMTYSAWYVINVES